MKKPKTLADHMNEVGRARCDLNMFYGVIALLEGGTIGPDSYAGTERIIAICKSESAKCLKRMDWATEAAVRRYDPPEIA